MTRELTVLGLSGSLRQGSYNTAALNAAVELVPEAMTLITASIRDVPLYDEDVKAAGIPAAVERLRAAVAAADAVLIVSPEYNYSVPGVLKNALDWLSRTSPMPFARKPVAILGASPGLLGTARAQYHLRQILQALNAHVLNRPEVMISNAAAKFDASGALVDAPTREHLGKLLAALAAWTLVLRPE